MEQEKKLLHWVRGNTLALAIPLEKETITEEQTTRKVLSSNKNEEGDLFTLLLQQIPLFIGWM